jgi:4-oxalocrotonate tautomerase
MPHIKIKTYPDVTEEQKQQLAQAITKQITEITGKPDMVVSIDIVEVAEDKWMDEVYATDIKPHLDRLYKKPGY